MSVEIHQPEIEALIQQRMASGAFHDVEDVLLYALRSAPQPVPADQRNTFGKQLIAAFAEARKILDGVELDIRRDPSAGRPLELS
jgi:hypothetical protein